MSTKAEILQQIAAAAISEGKSLGEWLYEALKEPFDFERPFYTTAQGNARTRRKYDDAAKAFAKRLAESIADEEEQPK